MPNQLTLPSKSTQSIPLRSALQDYIQSPEAFKWDIKQWEAMRRDAVTSVVHVDASQKYVAWVVKGFITRKRLIDRIRAAGTTRSWCSSLQSFPQMYVASFLSKHASLVTKRARLISQYRIHALSYRTPHHSSFPTSFMNASTSSSISLLCTVNSPHPRIDPVEMASSAR